MGMSSGEVRPVFSAVLLKEAAVCRPNTVFAVQRIRDELVSAHRAQCEGKLLGEDFSKAALRAPGHLARQPIRYLRAGLTAVNVQRNVNPNDVTKLIRLYEGTAATAMHYFH